MTLHAACFSAGCQIQRRHHQSQGADTSDPLGRCALTQTTKYAINRLRVFTSANTAHLGHRGGQEREPGVIPSEKYAVRRGSAEEGMRMITACFARAPRRCVSRPYMHFLLMFQEVRPISKTRNQLWGICPISCAV
jgi:hypothetical protein